MSRNWVERNGVIVPANDTGIGAYATSRMIQGLSSVQERNMNLLYMWRTDPLAMADGVEPILHLKIKKPHSEEFYKTITFLSEYKRLRNDILNSPAKSQDQDDEDNTLGGRVITRAAIGRSGGGRTSILSALRRALLQDEYLKNELSKEGLNLKVVTAPFPLFGQAAMVPRVGLVPDNLGQGRFEKQHYAAISAFGLETINHHVLTDIPKNEVRALFLESSTHATYPVSADLPMVVEGEGDRFNSVVYSLAVDERTKRQFVLYALDRNDAIKDESVKFRQETAVSVEDLRKGFGGKVRVIKVNNDGSEIEAENLQEEELRKVALLLNLSRVPAHAIERNDREAISMLERLYESGGIQWPTDLKFFEYLRQTLHLGRTRLRVLSSEWSADRMTLDTSYLTESLPLQLYPEILEQKP